MLQAEGPVLLLAVPGSGKTTVLVTRLGSLGEHHVLAEGDVGPGVGDLQVVGEGDAGPDQQVTEYAFDPALVAEQVECLCVLLPGVRSVS